eukprot:4936028-Pleurochrysis_carterae.AAC.2
MSGTSILALQSSEHRVLAARSSQVEPGTHHSRRRPLTLPHPKFLKLGNWPDFNERSNQFLPTSLVPALTVQGSSRLARPLGCFVLLPLNSRGEHVAIGCDSAEEQLEVVEAHGLCVGVADGTLDQRRLFLLQLEDPILNAVLHDEMDDAHGEWLADAVYTVDCLLLHRRVPPRVKHVDCLRRDQVESDAAGTEREQQHTQRRVRGEGAQRVRA